MEGDFSLLHCTLMSCLNYSPSAYIYCFPNNYLVKRSHTISKMKTENKIWFCLIVPKSSQMLIITLVNSVLRFGRWVCLGWPAAPACWDWGVYRIQGFRTKLKQSQDKTVTLLVRWDAGTWMSKFSSMGTISSMVGFSKVQSLEEGTSKSLWPPYLSYIL